MRLRNCEQNAQEILKISDRLETGIRRYERHKHKTKVYAILFILFSSKQAKVIIIYWPVPITFYWTNPLNLSPLTKIIEAIVGRDASINGIIIVRKDFIFMSADPFYQMFVKIQRRIQNSPTFPYPRVSGLSYLVHGNLIDSTVLSRTRYEGII